MDDLWSNDDDDELLALATQTEAWIPEGTFTCLSSDGPAKIEQAEAMGVYAKTEYRCNSYPIYKKVDGPQTIYVDQFGLSVSRDGNSLISEIMFLDHGGWKFLDSKFGKWKEDPTIRFEATDHSRDVRYCDSVVPEPPGSIITACSEPPASIITASSLKNEDFLTEEMSKCSVAAQQTEKKDGHGKEENVENEIQEKAKKTKTCARANCNNRGRHRCARCKSVSFCSEKCLYDDWSHHEMFCNYVFEANNPSEENDIGEVD